MLQALSNFIDSDKCMPIRDDAIVAELYAKQDFEALFNSGLKLVKARANARYYANLRFSYDDLFSAGMAGLIWAIKTWDASKGCKFSVWIYRAIDGYILNASYGAKYENSTVAAESLQSDDNDEGKDTKVINNIPDTRLTQEELVVNDEDIQLLNKLMTGEVPCDLSDLEKSVLKLYFGLGESGKHTMDQTAEILNYSKPGIRAILMRGLEKLKPFYT